MNEMSFESLMAVGTGLASPESKESKINGVPFDGYNDGVDMDLARTSEQLHFVDTYDKLQSLHSAEKLKMIKKISTAYNVKTIGNTNVANSVESFCNNAMSLEGVDVKAVAAKIKAKFIEIFKKIAEFFKNIGIKIVAAQYKGEVAEQIKAWLQQSHLYMNALIGGLNGVSEITEEKKTALNMLQKQQEIDRQYMMGLLKFFKLALAICKKNGTADKNAVIDQKFVDTDFVKNNVPIEVDKSVLVGAQKFLTDNTRKQIREKMLKVVKEDVANANETIASVDKQIKDDTELLDLVNKANEKMAQTLKETKGAAPAAEEKKPAKK